jgi:hypothetical protein
MSLTLAYLAMNPNLKAETLLELTRDHLASKAAAWKRLEELTKDLPIDQALQVYSHVLPIMLAW